MILEFLWVLWSQGRNAVDMGDLLDWHNGEPHVRLGACLQLNRLFQQGCWPAAEKASVKSSRLYLGTDIDIG